MQEENPFNEDYKIEGINPDIESSKVNEELKTLSLTTDKYKALVIDGVSIPSTVRTDSLDEPYVITKARTISDLTQDEIKWLDTNINFIVDNDGDFIQISSGNQFVFYQTLLRIQYFIWTHNIPVEFFENARYRKVLYIGDLIEFENCNTGYVPEYEICVDVNMSAYVDTKAHAIKKFNRETYNLFENRVNVLQNIVDKTSGKTTIKTGSRLLFKNIDSFAEWLKEFVITRTEDISKNNIINMFYNLNPIYLNDKLKTTDTFGFFANPKGWIAQMSGGSDAAFKLNIIIFPKFVGRINLTTLHANFKDIDAGLEQVSGRCKGICDSYIYKKV